MLANQGRLQQFHSDKQDFVVPEGYRLESLTSTSLDARTPTDPLWKELQGLWEAAHGSQPADSDGEVPREGGDVPVPAITTDFVYWALQYPGAQLYMIRCERDTDRTRKGGLVASLVSLPSVIDTPVEHGVSVFLIDKLCVHPNHRAQRLVPALVSACVRNNARRADASDEISSDSPTTDLVEPIGLFAVELDFANAHQNRLPFSDVARVMRVYQTVSPTMLVDPPAEVSYRLVDSSVAAEHWPTKLHESSEYRRTAASQTERSAELRRVFGSAAAHRTLEPCVGTKSRMEWCSYVAKHPNHSLLSVGGTDWIHLTHHETEPSSVPQHLVCLVGTSFDRHQLPQLPQYVYAFIRKTYASHAASTQVSLVIPHGLQTYFAHSSVAPKYTSAGKGVVASGRVEQEEVTHTKTDSLEPSPPIHHHHHHHSDWIFYDAHYIYMHNYRLHQKRVLLPHTFDLPIY
jgi:hypothetical protein